MITEKDIAEEIKDLSKALPTDFSTTGGTTKQKRAAKRIMFLRDCLTYVQGGPTRKFIEKEIAKINNRVDLLKKDYSTWLQLNPDALKKKQHPEAIYAKEKGVPKMKRHLRVLNYLLRGK